MIGSEQRRDSGFSQVHVSRGYRYRDTVCAGSECGRNVCAITQVAINIGSPGNVSTDIAVFIIVGTAGKTNAGTQQEATVVARCINA